MPSAKRQQSSSKALSIIANVLRFILGSVFIFSGFVKAIDPWGVVYKLTDYAEAFGLTVSQTGPLWLWLAMLLCLFEFVLGICIFFAAWRKTALSTALAFLLVMTPLTLYLAIANPISDCGCFGEAIKLTNWQTFGKNVVLLAITIFLLFNCKKLFHLISRTWQWMVIGFAIVSLYLFMNDNLRHLPVVDFRPYHIGADIEASMEVPDSVPQPVYETKFILEKEGKKREFTLEDYPDSTWTFVTSRTTLKKAGYIPPIHDFELIDTEGNDLTETLFEPGYCFLMVIRELWAEDMHDIINDLYDYAQANGYPFFALTSSNDADVARWKEQTGALYDFCLLDDITLKTMIRSNPGVLLVKDGVIVNKWSRHDIPRDELLTASLDQEPWAERTKEELHNRFLKILCLMFIPYFLLVGISYLAHRNRKEKRTEKNETNNTSN